MVVYLIFFFKNTATFGRGIFKEFFNFILI